MEDSFENFYSVSDKQFILPLSPKKSLMISGSRKPKGLNITLNQIQCLILWALGVHARGFEFTGVTDSVKCLAYGWVQISNPALAQQVNSLATLLRNTDYPLIEVEESNRVLHFRLSLPSDSIFFDEQAFTLCLQDDALILTMNACDTPLGTVAGIRKEMPISNDLSKRLRTYCDDKTLLDSDVGWDDSLRKLKDKYQISTMGLRRLVVYKSGKPRICCELTRGE